MAKKKARNQPIVAEEPARADEQISLDESKVAPPSSRPLGESTTRSVTGNTAKTYGARSARERRAGRASRSTASPSRRSSRKPGELRTDYVSNLLEHPTKTVSEDDLRKEYSYVTSDLRGMGIIALGLIVTLAILAQVLPK